MLQVLGPGGGTGLWRVASAAAAPIASSAVYPPYRVGMRDVRDERAYMHGNPNKSLTDVPGGRKRL